MGERSKLGVAQRRLTARRIVNRYLVALEREEHLDDTDGVGEPTAPSPALESVALQSSFISVAAEFGRRHGITHATWLEARVSAEVLEAAGVWIARPDTADAKA